MSADPDLLSGFTDSGELDDRWPARSADEIVRAGVLPTEWDIDGLVTADDGPVILYGPPGSYKSWIALHATMCMVNGEPFLGRYRVRRRPCAVYLNFDAGAKAVERRVALLGRSHPHFDVRSPDGWDADLFRKSFERYQGGAVSIDCLADIFQPDPKMDQAQAMREFARDVRKLYADYGCGGFLTDHSKRPNSARPNAEPEYYGSVQKKAAFRQMWSIAELRDDRDQTRTAARISCEKPGDFERWRPFVVDLNFSEAIVTLSHGGSPSDVMVRPEVQRQDAMLSQIEASPGPVTREQFGATGALGGKAKIDFDALLHDKKIKPTGTKDGRKHLYSTPARIDALVKAGLSLNPVQPGTGENPITARD